MRSIARYIPAVLFLHCKHVDKKQDLKAHNKIVKKKSNRNNSGIKIFKVAEPQKENM